MELHPFSPKRLEFAKTVSLKQRNCESIAWKWALAMLELCWGREGGKSPQAVSFLLPLSLTCLPSAVAHIFHGLVWEDQCFDNTGSKSFGVTELWQQLGGLIINCCYCRETSTYCNYLGFLFSVGWAGELYLFSELEKKKMKSLAKLWMKPALSGMNMWLAESWSPGSSWTLMLISQMYGPCLKEECMTPAAV